VQGIRAFQVENNGDSHGYVKTSTIVYVLHSIKDALNLKSHLAELRAHSKAY
jgi:hypothetical protein